MREIIESKEQGYKCVVCGGNCVLSDVSIKNDTELWTCELCGSYMLFRYKNDGVHLLVYDSFENIQYRIIYDWNKIIDKFNENLLRGDKK